MTPQERKELERIRNVVQALYELRVLNMEITEHGPRAARCAPVTEKELLTRVLNALEAMLKV
jgi:hypothetical protein